MTAEKIAAQITSQLPDVKRGSLSVFGDIFGGRVDNIHTIIRARAVGSDHLTVEFDDGESLDVIDPQDAVISAQQFLIRSASRVRWEWFYYGRPRLPENRFFIEHRHQGRSVHVSTDRIGGLPTSAPSIASPAIELLGFT